MNQIQLWHRYQQHLCSVPTLGISVDISRMNFADAFLSEMEPQIQSAFAQMNELEKGAIANPDEKRMVGHYWLRNTELAPTDELRKAINVTVARIKEFSQHVHIGKLKPETQPLFKNLLIIGIGGSALGPQFVNQALGHPGEDKLRAYFFDNTDPDGMDMVIKQIEQTGGLATTLTIVISKSGGTKETRNGQLEAKEAYKKANLHFEHHAVAVTGEGSELSLLAARDKWIMQFPMWDWVGGRTSELSAVGLLPAALQGIDIAAMLKGANLMDTATRVSETKKNPAALLALMWHYATGGKGSKDMVILPYKDRLLLFSRYLQQLVMESLGKEKDLKGNSVFQGISVYGNKGSTDQHAYVQQLREGVLNFFITFIEVLKDRETASMMVEPDTTSGDYLQGFLLGSRQALYETNRESITITIPEVSPQVVGALIALYERAVGFYASLVGINAYHQPGVEAGKKAATSVLKLQLKTTETLKAGRGKAFTADQLADTMGEMDSAETIYHILQHLAANKRHVKMEGTAPGSATFQWM
jgi:glucose-6-phosphate isomerase